MLAGGGGRRGAVKCGGPVGAHIHAPPPCMMQALPSPTVFTPQSALHIPHGALRAHAVNALMTLLAINTYFIPSISQTYLIYFD
jgi:hypothetical protein